MKYSMRKPGQVVLFSFPQTNQKDSKLRPALLIGKLQGLFDDWLICMISTNKAHCFSGFDEIVNEEAADFSESGLKVESLIRIGRLAVVDGKILIGTIGEIDLIRLQRIKTKLADWLNT
jgi:mRNA interferase MazF